MTAHLARRDGELTLGGVGANDLARTYGTPVLVIDFDAFDSKIETFVRACARHNAEMAYAGKALLLVALVRHLARRSITLDVCSIGELLTAERGAMPPERIAFHGCGKTDDELDAVIAGRTGTVIVDGIAELERFEERARGKRVPAQVLLRINTGIEAHTHEFVRTGGDKTKFGLSGADLERALDVLAASASLQFAGLHSHIGSQIFEEAAFVENVRALMDVAARFAARGLTTHRLIAGGGFGVPSRPEDAELPVERTIEAIATAVAQNAQRLQLPVPRLGIEPGRALIAQAGTSLYRVMAVKNQFGRPFAIVDGGIADNPRPALYDAYHHPVAASREATSLRETVLCGRSCENDQLVIAPLPDDLCAGELIALCTTGAYTYSMASNYNRFARPAVVAVRHGEHRQIARRESLDDVLRNDCDT